MFALDITQQRKPERALQTQRHSYRCITKLHNCAMQGLAIDAGGIAIFGYLLKRDLDAREKQIARMTREEDLGSLQIELANKKTLRLAQLRQFVRIVSCKSPCHASAARFHLPGGLMHTRAPVSQQWYLLHTQCSCPHRRAAPHTHRVLALHTKGCGKAQN